MPELRDPPGHVLVVGSGVAGLETVIALRALASASLRITLVTAEPTFRYRPLELGEPFGYGRPRHHDIVALGEELRIDVVCDTLESVDPEQRTAKLHGSGDVTFDTLVVTVGARPYPAYEFGVTFDRASDSASFDEVLEDRRSGLVSRLAILVPPGVSWTLPAYELALFVMADAAGQDVEVTVVTPEPTPLAAFGERVSAAVQDLLRSHGVRVRAGSMAEPMADTALMVLPEGVWVEVDRIVALPSLGGPRVPGLPCDAHGFVPVDDMGRVPGAGDIYAAGDGTTYWMKQGGLAAQQADVIARQIARAGGADAEPQPLRPVLRGVLPTLDGPRYLRADLTGREPPQISDQPLWWPATKVASRWLGPYLARREADAEAGSGSASAG
jgi:sulfide:quinone oxidoreductase